LNAQIGEEKGQKERTGGRECEPGRKGHLGSSKQGGWGKKGTKQKGKGSEQYLKQHVPTPNRGKVTV